MGVTATFVSANLVRQFGILKVKFSSMFILVIPCGSISWTLSQALPSSICQAGAVGLIFQAALLTVAVAVYLSGSLSRQSPLLFFLSMIVRILLLYRIISSWTS